MDQEQQKLAPEEASTESTEEQEAPVTPATAYEKLQSVALWGRSLAWLLPWTSSMIALNRLVGPGRIQPVSRAFCAGMLKSAGSKWKAVVDPAVREDESYVFAQNHVNHFDFVTMHNATPHFKQGIELETHFKYPFYGWFMKSRGTIAVPAERKKRTDSIRRQMKQETENHRSILAFPEGTRTLDGRVGKFRTGIFYIARDLGLKVVPTAVTGMFEVMRKGSLVIRPGDVTVYCDAPIDFAGLSDEEVPQQVERVRDAIAARVNAHMAAQADNTQTIETGRSK